MIYSSSWSLPDYLPSYIYLIFGCAFYVLMFYPRIREIIENNSPRLRNQQKIKGKYTLPITWSPRLLKISGIYLLIFLGTVILLDNTGLNSTNLGLAMAIAFLMLSSLLIHDNYRLTLSLRIGKSIAFNGSTFNAADIAAIELWDDLILIRITDDTEKNTGSGSKPATAPEPWK
ncbi:MAG: hypothetical protein Roseis2KO_08550 [Roseivirga sp.]